MGVTTAEHGTFAFSTKAGTLGLLQGALTKSAIPPFAVFTVAEWRTDPAGVVRALGERFTGTVVVRSSAQNEDSYQSSKAGYYHSVLDVPARDLGKLSAAIQEVIASYAKDHAVNGEDQVLVQEQVGDVQLAGVAFTRDIETGAPYYVINYDDHSGRTDIITSGVGQHQKIFTYCKLYHQRPSDHLIALVVDALREIESVTGNDALDVEFVISGDAIYTLQVRPIAALKDLVYSEKEFRETLEGIKQYLRDTATSFPNVAGKTVGYGIMPDWNPAEIIGVDPKPLAFSIYRYLITDNVWPLSRQLLGYEDVGHQPGIVSLAGKPYVDIRMSFNTFTPAGLDPELREKLIEFYIQKLRRYQDYHDKVEFQVVHTCYTFDFDRASRELLEAGFFSDEIAALKAALLTLTDGIVAQRVTTIEHELRKVALMGQRRRNILRSKIPRLMKVAQLGHDCKLYGTLPFSKLARFAFIGSAMLRSLVRTGRMTQEEYDAFLASIVTVATEFLWGLGALKRDEIAREEFLAVYGHLRPGTYDICSRTYAEGFDAYIDLERFVPPPHMTGNGDLAAETMERIDAALREHGFSVDGVAFLAFARQAVMGRERAKFEFTKNLSVMLELIEEEFAQHGVSRDDLAFLEINDVLDIAYGSLRHDTIDTLKGRIVARKEQYKTTRMVRLPPVIFIEKSVEYFRSTDMSPNYVTNKTVCAEVVDVSAGVRTDLAGKIVLIENADPGYDWIFSHDIAGLITEFGGANSHMAIRAAEFRLPAAIGCGSTLFAFARGCKKIELDCGAKQIRAVL